jgi:hypothetical protein
METKYYSLSTSENNGFLRIIRIIFGAVCIAVAIFWITYNIRSLKTDIMLWITIIFLSGFGFYQIWSGLGLAKRFIEIGNYIIRLKKNPFLAPVTIYASDIEKIELFPLCVVFFIKSKMKILLRFGTTYYETNDKVKDGILLFAESNNITIEIIEDKI